MNKAVLFPTDRYRVTASEEEERKNLAVYTTLTGECTMQESAKAPEEILAEYNGLKSWCRARTRKSYYVTHTFREHVTLEIGLPEGTESLTVKPTETAVVRLGDVPSVVKDAFMFFFGI